MIPTIIWAHIATIHDFPINSIEKLRILLNSGTELRIIQNSRCDTLTLYRKGTGTCKSEDRNAPFAQDGVEVLSRLVQNRYVAVEGLGRRWPVARSSSRRRTRYVGGQIYSSYARCAQAGATSAEKYLDGSTYSLLS